MEDREKYCLQKHFAAFYRQSKCREPADFAEPCADCRLLVECHADWDGNILKDDFPKDISINVQCSVSPENRGKGLDCPSRCIDHNRHIQSLTSYNDGTGSE